MKPIKIYKREAYLLLKSELDAKTVDKLVTHNTHMFFEDKVCAGCEWKEDRDASESGLSEACESCAAFKGGVGLSKEVIIKDKRFLSLPIGDRKAMEKILDRDIVYKSKHVETDFKRPIKFTGVLKNYQEEAVATICKKKNGVIKAPPRSGKTVLSTAAICRIGKKAIIVAAQREWLDGFYETFCGSETQPALTNAKKSQVGFARTMEEFDKYDVCLVTYQTFNSERGQKLLKKIRDKFTFLCVDEVHMGAANKFASFISKMNVKYKIGLSGTPNRKDGRFKLVRALLGPNIYEAKVERLKPRVALVRTQYVKSYRGKVLWTTMVKSLETDPKRLKLIAEWAIKDAKNGHMVIIPLSQIAPIKALTMAINKMAGKKMAHAFYGGLKKDVRKKMIQDARTYKVRILVGNSKLVSTGTNIPRASCLYEVAMSSNVENCEQRVSRILTPYEDKPPPLLRIFLDESNVRKRCMSNEWFQCIKPKFKPVISVKDEQIMKSYLSEKKSQGISSWEM